LRLGSFSSVAVSAQDHPLFSTIDRSARNRTVFRRERIDRSCPAEPVSSGGVSHIVGGGNTSALHPSFLYNQIWRSRVVLPPEPDLKELVHDVVAATTDITQLKQTIEDLKGQLADLDEQVAERTIKNGPYSSAWQRFKPETKDQWLAFINILVPILIFILTVMISNQLSEQQAKVTQEQQQQIVERIEEVNEHLEEDQDTDQAGVEQLKKVNEHLERLEKLEAQRDASSPADKPRKHH
jgi:hypothetical protein